MEFYLISLLHLILCLLTFFTVVRAIKRQGLSATSLGALTFIIISTFGLSFSHYVNYGIALRFGDDTGMVVYKNLEHVYMRQVISHWILMLFFCFAIRLQGRIFIFNAKSISIFSPFVWRVILISVAIIGYSRYFIFGPGLETLISTNLVYFSAEDAVAARSLANENFYGQGVYMAAVVAYIILPVLFAEFALNSGKSFRGAKSSRLYYILFISFFILSFIYAFQTRQKYPIVTVILTYLLLHMSKNADLISSEQKKKKYLYKIVVGGGGLFLVSASLYVLVFGMSFIDSMYATITRAFLVPSATEANYFYVFPDLIPYRGILDSFVIRVFYPPGVMGVSIYDVSMAATGNEFSANASFLAIGWSGFGFLGVVFVAVSLCFGLLLLDGMMRNCSRQIRRLVLALSISPLLVLNSGSFLDYLGAGGILGGMLFLFILRDKKPNFDYR